MQIGLLYKVFETLGTPTAEEWSELHLMSHYNAEFPKWKAKDIKAVGVQHGAALLT